MRPVRTVFILLVGGSLLFACGSFGVAQLRRSASEPSASVATAAIPANPVRLAECIDGVMVDRTQSCPSARPVPMGFSTPRIPPPTAMSSTPIPSGMVPIPTPPQATATPMVMSSLSATETPTSSMPLPSFDRDLGVCPQCTPPRMIAAHQVVLMHGDIDVSGTCHYRVFTTGQTVPDLGSGQYRMKLIQGTQMFIDGAIARDVAGAAAAIGGVCPAG